MTRLVVLAEMLSVHISIYAPLSPVHTECTPLVHFYISGPGCLLAKYLAKCLNTFIFQVFPVRSDSLSVSRISVAIRRGMNCEVKVSLNF